MLLPSLPYCIFLPAKSGGTILKLTSPCNAELHVAARKTMHSMRCAHRAIISAKLESDRGQFVNSE